MFYALNTMHSNNECAFDRYVQRHVSLNIVSSRCFRIYVCVCVGDFYGFVATTRDSHVICIIHFRLRLSEHLFCWNNALQHLYKEIPVHGTLLLKFHTLTKASQINCKLSSFYAFCHWPCFDGLQKKIVLWGKMQRRRSKSEKSKAKNHDSCWKHTNSMCAYYALKKTIVKIHPKSF